MKTKKSWLKYLALLMVAILILPIPCLGQLKTYQQVYPSRSQDERVGKYFWLLPNSDSIVRIAFCKSPTSPYTKYVNRLYPTEIIRVKILKFLPGSKTTKFEPFYKLQLDDERIVYLEKLSFDINSCPYTSDSLTINNYRLAEDCLSGVMGERWFTEHPDKLRKKIEQLKAAEKKEYELQRAKGPAKLGMTESQVINDTMWGEPIKRNRTVAGGIVWEQWIYNNDQYLYFTNGKLTSWQVSED